MHNIKGLKAVSLLRVSTNKQTSKNENDEKDIPAQRDLVRKFIEDEELILIQEFVEGGISGFKTKVSDRDALTSIKAMASRGEFQILVVYYSDRIGRSSEESPLVISYLNNHDVRVFSTREGELKSKSQMDKLMTYLTYWQSESESVKIANRSTDYRVIQVQNGAYQGGNLPYGYRLTMNGSTNSKGRVIYDFEIDPEQAEMVKLIYKLSIENNMGARAIASYLNENQEYKTKSKTKDGWTFRVIQNIMNNSIYKGSFHMKSKWREQTYYSPIQENLTIIPEEIWERNQQIIQGRKNKGNKPIKGISKGKALLSGLIYCGHCGEKMHIWDNHKRVRKDGSKYITHSYRCNTKLTKVGKKECIGQSTYSCAKIDFAVESLTKSVAKEMSKNKLSNDFYEQLKEDVFILIKKKKDNEDKLESKQKKIIKLKKSIPDAMDGEGEFTVSELKEAMALIQDDIEELLEKTHTIDNDLHQARTTLNEFDRLENDLANWDKRYNNADIMEKKALLSQLVERVTVTKDGIDIEYKIYVNTFKENSMPLENIPANITEEWQGENNKNMGCERELDGRTKDYKTQPYMIRFKKRVNFNVAS